MKAHITILLILTFLFSHFVYGQNINGIATYKSQRKMDIQMDSTKMSDVMQSQMMAMIKKQFEKEYTLDFTADESIYKEVESLDAPSSGGGNMVFVVGGGGEADILYKNIKENRFANQNEMFSKEFLILDSIERPEWVMGKETKNIGEYTCFKATYTREVRVMTSMTISEGDDNDDESDEEAADDEMEEQTITAWYTPQIPVKNGPGMYGGLPGLILEVSDGTESILCSKIVLNPKKGVNIKEPTKGKKVSNAEYEEIMDKKMKEMNEQRQRDGRRGDGHSIEFRIGG
jgi:GLPGLI family protein